jgi:predicted dinucleotide-binding enzyme
VDPVAIIGTGNVGRALGRRLKEIGVPVRFGVREPGSEFPEEVRSIGGTFSVADACAPVQMIFLAVPAPAAVSAVGAAAPFHGKVLVDCTNPLLWQDGPVWNPPREGSVTAAIASAYPELRVVKAFNHFGSEIHAVPALEGGPADAYVAGDDEAARAEVRALAEKMGFRALDAGGLRNAAVLENLAVLWIHLAMKSGLERSFAFRAEAQAR